ncbi:MAG: GNAT family N-acetyltransferase [Cyclobacteriaceae bacterium]
MSIQELTTWGNETVMMKRFGSLYSKLTTSSSELLGSFKGEIVVKKLGVSEDEGTRSMIRNVLLEFGGIGIDSYYFDDELDYLVETYNRKGHRMMVAIKDGEVIGSAGIKPMRCDAGQLIEEVCELQKVYVKTQYRDKGIGRRLIRRVFQEARSMGYTNCHVTTNPIFKQFESLLVQLGFEKSDLKVKKCGESAFDRHLIKEL